MEGLRNGRFRNGRVTNDSEGGGVIECLQRRQQPRRGKGQLKE